MPRLLITILCLILLIGNAIAADPWYQKTIDPVFASDYFIHLTPAAEPKTYLAIAGGWQITFKSSTPIYTETEFQESTNGAPGYYSIWIGTSPGYYARAGCMHLFTFAAPIPTQESTLKYLLEASLSSMKIKPSYISSRVIDGKSGLISHDWWADLGKTLHSAIIPMNNPTTDKLVAIFSALDESTTDQILNSLHIEPPLAQSTTFSSVQPSLSTGSNSWAARGSGTMGRPASTSPSYTAPSSHSAPPQSTYNIADNSGCPYIGNSNTKKYHEPGCSQVPKINPAHRVCFSSRAEAEAAGYVHCQKC